jgi:hypothetical protein
MWEKNSDMMNTGFWVSIGETGQQLEKKLNGEFLSNQKNSDNRYLKKTVCYKKRISYLEFIRSMLF